MSNFFKTANNHLINVNAIQAITSVNGTDIYCEQNDLSLVGREIVKIFSDDEKKIYLGGSKITGGNAWYWDKSKVKYPHKTIAYTIHTAIPNGGINNSHLMFHIKPDEMEKLKKVLKI